MENKHNENWIVVGGEAAPELSRQLSESVARRISEGKYTQKDIEIVSKIELPLIDGKLNVNAKDLEKLRELCKLWDVDLKPLHISSHRKFIGPVIVAAKKLFYPFVRAIFKESHKQQREFNAATISMIAEILNRGSEQGEIDGTLKTTRRIQ